MAATDQTYRNQKILDRVFAASCIGMLLGSIWMFYQDYAREFKTVQRHFRNVETALNEAQMLDQMPDVEEVNVLVANVSEKRKQLNEGKRAVEKDEKDIQARRDKATENYQKIKADLDSRASYYDIAVDEHGKESPSAQRLFNELVVLKEKLVEAQTQLDNLDEEYKEKVTKKLEKPQDAFSMAEDDLKKLTAPFDRYAKVTAQKAWKFGDTFRDWPIIDGFASPTRINQIVLNDLTIDYGGFRDVPRYDRCTTCHLGIEKASYDTDKLLSVRDKEVLTEKQVKERVQKLVDTQKIIDSPEARKAAEQELRKGERFNFVHAKVKERQKKLDKAREILLERARRGENLGFDMSDLPTQVRTVPLTAGQIKQFQAHPRLDLFVDSNSPHPMQKVGCTICHAGQGSATDFQLANHTPADTRQEKEWHKNYDWHSSHFWDFPMLSSRFVESSCLKCHHQVTDLIRYGSKEEAPKLLRGYNLVRENGCFGCHEIAGIKGGRPVGPDLRLEPLPALEWLTAAEQDKAKSDPANPPGTYRKVGPGLRRLAEKTNQTWTRKWILDPRDFREDTKMPHFYNLSNNNQDDLPKDQKQYPATEIHSLAYYLLAESKASLEGKDTYRLALEGNLARWHKRLMQQEEEKGPLNVKEKKELDAVARQLADLYLLSAPANAPSINDLYAKQKALQDRLQEIQTRLLADPEQAKSLGEEAKTRETELAEATKKLSEAGKPTPLGTQVISWDGSSKDLPKDGDEKRQGNGQKLFTEKGCLACHSHDGTTFPQEKIDVMSEANFGPNLTRLRSKLTPEGGKAGDNRRWLIQWLLNPNIHHPRTRMPVTQLNLDEAADIADWLLNVKTAKSDWKGNDPAEPTLEDLVALARVYLAKAPGMTRRDVNEILPEGAKEVKDLKGIGKAKLEKMVRDAEEHRLAEGKVTEDALKWYIGKKSITRLGCFACHDLPGFETSKPIGTALNDWGKKDAERLAFEDGHAFVEKHFNIVESLDSSHDKAKVDAEESKGSKPPFEKFFAEALHHHDRQGFLHLKLAEPRSYDYNRIRNWDDRLRMPQFQFARTRQKKDESPEAYFIRKSREEAEAREAVMTFILGLTADPVPLKHVYIPKGDKLAEVKGRQVLEKYNCAGCHQVRAGVYDFKPSKESLDKLEKTYDTVTKASAKNFTFSDHNAWVGSPSPFPDRLVVHGTSQRAKGEEPDDTQILVRLTEALRFTNKDRVVRDLPAGTVLTLPTAELSAQDEQYGGTFGRLLYDYLETTRSQTIKNDDDARNVVPPPLLREGERVQPNWLYQFLLKPHAIRPQVILRMPQFNMSPEESMALVEYFTGVDRLSNPIAGTTSAFVALAQRDDGYWKRKTAEYVARLQKDDEGKKKLEKRLEKMKPVWEQVHKEQLDLAKGDLDTAEKQVKATPMDDAAKEARDKLKAKVEELEKDKNFEALKKEWLEKDAYAADAYRLLRSPPAGKRICLTCHSVGDVGPKNAPPLDHVSERLRPEWTRKWISHPERMFAYKTTMPVAFEKGDRESQDLFDGDAEEQIMAIRDVLLDFPRIANLPVNRFYRPAMTGAPPAPK